MPSLEDHAHGVLLRRLGTRLSGARFKEGGRSPLLRHTILLQHNHTDGQDFTSPQDGDSVNPSARPQNGLLVGGPSGRRPLARGEVLHMGLSLGHSLKKAFEALIRIRDMEGDLRPQRFAPASGLVGRQELMNGLGTRQDHVHT
eukprot:8402434-Alexandrium_andersonii.AAC.1